MTVIVIIALFTIALVAGHNANELEDFEPVISEECINQGYCTDVPNYPTEFADETIKKLQEEGSWEEKVPEPSSSRNMIFTWGGVIVELCQARSEIIHPLAAIDKTGAWFSVLQSRSGKQGFRVEICKNAGGSCMPIALFPDGYTGGCKQENVYERMHAFDKNGKTLIKELQIPSSCACTMQPKLSLV